jgi:dipeptidyl aminopeptidase/acylaminoacyl peptidase
VNAGDGTPRAIPGIGRGANFLAIAGTGSRLAYSQWFSNMNIWRYQLAGAGSEPQRPLISSTRADVSPQYSPDRTRIAFRSNRSGSTEIWVSDAEGGNARPLTSSNGVLTGSPRWSPDSQWLAFDSRPAGSSQVFVVSASGGPARQLTGGAADNVTPSWSTNGGWIYFASNRSGTWQVWKTPSDSTAGQDRAVQITHAGGFVPFESADGRFVYYAKGKSSPGVWRRPAQGGAEEVFVPDLKVGLWGAWALSRDSLFYVSPLPGGPAGLFAAPLASGRAARIISLQKAPLTDESGLSVSSDGTSLLYVQADHSGSEIMLVENFR